VSGGGATEPPPNDAYWVEPGRLLAGPYPGSTNEAQARERLTAYHGVGITTFIDLTDEAEGLQRYASLLPELAPGTRHHRFPILDADVPTHIWMRRIQAAIDSALDRGDAVYVHCWGGVGRTGTVVACHLIERYDLDAEGAIGRLAELRASTMRARAGRVAPETDAQLDFVHRWAASGGAELVRQDLVLAWLGWRGHRDGDPAWAAFTERRYRAVAGAFGIDPEAIVDEANAHADRRDAAALLAATIRAGERMRSPFVGFEGAAPELLELWVRYAKPIDRPLADLRSAFVRLAEEALALAVGEDAAKSVHAAEVARRGFDLAEDPPP
jgi:predicted protein tyrosine phosphatase